ncbi:MAG TPA: hypothetical protein DHW76_00240 [Clostridiaceae bacterium]|nr:hypothetical protein [Clostridiaceae bacterium]
MPIPSINSILWYLQDDLNLVWRNGQDRSLHFLILKTSKCSPDILINLKLSVKFKLTIQNIQTFLLIYSAESYIIY